MELTEAESNVAIRIKHTEGLIPSVGGKAMKAFAVGELHCSQKIFTDGGKDFILIRSKKTPRKFL